LAADALRRDDELVIFDNLYRNGSRENLAWLQTQGKFTLEQSKGSVSIDSTGRKADLIKINLI